SEDAQVRLARLLGQPVAGERPLADATQAAPQQRHHRVVAVAAHLDLVEAGVAGVAAQPLVVAAQPDVALEACEALGLDVVLEEVVEAGRRRRQQPPGAIGAGAAQPGAYPLHGVDLELQARARRVDHVVRAHAGPLHAQRRPQTERPVPTDGPQEVAGTRGVGKWHAELWGRPVRPETGSGKKLEAVGLPAWGDLTKAGRTSRPPPRPSCTLAASTGGGPCRRGGGGCP